MKKKLSAQKPGIEAGIWIESMTPATDLSAQGGAGNQPFAPRPPGPDMPQAPANNGQPTDAGPNTNAVTFICRAVDLSKITGDSSSSVDHDLAFVVESEVKNSPFVDPKSTSLTGSLSQDDATSTFTFALVVSPTNAPGMTTAPVAPPPQ
jgi:hypothetical protein